jgi:hypothetical protein
MSFFSRIIRKLRKKKVRKAVTSGSLTSRFQTIYQERFWSGASASGPGSSLEQTTKIRARLPGLLEDLGVKILLDAPCGDFFWMKHVDLGFAHYIGGDIVPELIEDNENKYGSPKHRFEVVDLVASPLPDADLLLCRDVLVHLSYEDINKALKNLCDSNIKWLLTTHFPEHQNEDIPSGLWRPINLRDEPFSLPVPTELIDDTPSEGSFSHPDKTLGLWAVSDLREYIS